VVECEGRARDYKVFQHGASRNKGKKFSLAKWSPLIGQWYQSLMLPEPWSSAPPLSFMNHKKKILMFFSILPFPFLLL
jgi:hypothetical protein